MVLNWEPSRSPPMVSWPGESSFSSNPFMKYMVVSYFWFPNDERRRGWATVSYFTKEGGWSTIPEEAAALTEKQASSICNGFNRKGDGSIKCAIRKYGHFD
jgi:hypothetical protein